MNERIRELAERLDTWYPDQGWFIFNDEQLEKFADLIVLESSKWIVDNSSSMEQLGPEFFAMGLCKHFGVK